MTLVRFKPFDEFEDFTSQIHNCVNPFADWMSTASFTPKANLYELNGKLNVEVELPGFKKEDLQLKIEDNVLTISGSKSKTEDERMYLINEIYSGEFSRSINLPDYADSQSTFAKFENGVLTITIDRVDEKLQKEKTIKVN